MFNAKYSSHINQDLLEQQLKVIFPKERTFVNSKKQLKLSYPFSGKHLELDIWIPSHNIGFEFQDSYHYITTWYAQHTLDYIQNKDSIKKGKTQEIGVYLIEVPCWWDGSVESLSATIYFQRPDLISKQNGSPISLNPPDHYFPSPELSSVGELMLASFPRDLDFNTADIQNNWWMGEKYDGVRCCWNPHHSIAYTRNGRQLPIPSSMCHSLPLSFLDGEFWFGRNSFSHVNSLCSGSPEFVCWHFLRLICFDLPEREYQKLPFEKRYSAVLHSLSLSHPFCIAGTRILLRNGHQLNQFASDVITCEGEGVIIRKVNSLYFNGRNINLIKFKTAIADREALVVSVTDDSVMLKLPNNQHFSVSRKEIFFEIQKGDIVTFSFEVNSRKDLPQNPKVDKLRPDLIWDDVLINYSKDRKFLNEFSQIQNSTLETTSGIMGIWNHIQNRRKFFENYASKNNFDPLVAENWYQQSTEKIMSAQGAARVVLYHSDSVPNALIDLFPDIGLQKHKFLSNRTSPNTAAVHAKDRSRKFFESFAIHNQFDPLILDHWLQQPKNKILSSKGIARIIKLFYKGSIAKALADLFPTISGFDKQRKWITQANNNEKITNFQQHPKILSRITWKDNLMQRKFFEEYAAANNFDPLVNKNWYFHKDKILSAPGISNILPYYEYNVGQTLASVFPNIGLVRSHLRVGPAWPQKEERKKFFEKFANDHKFDPLVMDNWLSRPKTKIWKGGYMIEKFYKGNVILALEDVFPNISKV